MPLNLLEVHGHVLDSPNLGNAIRQNLCPFTNTGCAKRFPDQMPNGACSAQATKELAPVIFCPQRLYAENYLSLRNVAQAAFGPEPQFVSFNDPLRETSELFVLPFGQKMGGEVRIKMRGTAFAVDWILALVNRAGDLLSFVPVEVQTVDTTGNYRLQSWLIHSEHQNSTLARFPKPQISKSSNFNYENVNKRIIPQLLSKSHAVRRESLCTKGLFFICPTPVFQRVLRRLGGQPESYAMQPGSITFHHYDIAFESNLDPKPLRLSGSFTTTTEQLALAFSGATGLPAPGVYENEIRKAIRARLSS